MRSASAMRRVGAVVIGIGIVVASMSILEACGFRASGRIGVARAARQAQKSQAKAGPPSTGSLVIYRGAADSDFEAEAKRAGFQVSHASDAQALSGWDRATTTVVAAVEDAAAVRALGIRVVPVAQDASSAPGYPHVITKAAPIKDKLEIVRAAASSASTLP